MHFLVRYLHMRVPAREARRVQPFNNTIVSINVATVTTSPTDFRTFQAEQLSRFEGERWVLFGDIIRVGE